MISKFILKFGRIPGQPGETINATPITVFVGPNNSGKSKIISEIESYCRTGQKVANSLLLDELFFNGLSENESRLAIEQIKLQPNPSEIIHSEQVLVGSRYGRTQLGFNQLQQSVLNPHSNLTAFCQWFLTHKTLLLNGGTRINLVQAQSAGDLQQAPQTSLQVLFKDEEKRLEVRRIVFDAFNCNFVIDPTNVGSFRIRLAKRAPSNNQEEQALDSTAIRFHGDAQLIDNASDGVKAFTGIVSEIIAGDPRVLLVDEPEAFLHPALASKLGYEISLAAKKTDKRVFVSTHSPAFVMGCIQSGAPVNIIRLTYRDQIATARVLPNNEIQILMRNPLLRSTGVLSGLFYEFVIVTEGDADRAFYQEINERLLSLKSEWGIPNCLFIHAQSKQTIPTIVGPLRKLGIPAIGIVDVDVIKEGGVVWTKLLTSASIPAISIQALATTRASVYKAFDKTGKDMKRDGGIYILENDELEAAKNLISQLNDYGIFVVEGGELESWLKPLQASGHGPHWLIDIFEKMGENPESPGYLKPAHNDVWFFLSTIKKWLVDPDRKGIPA